MLDGGSGRAGDNVVHDDGPCLVARACAGDGDAFHAIFRRYFRPVLTFIYGLLGNRSQAEELAQETFVRAYRRLDTVRDKNRLSTWLFGIARNVVREAVKVKYTARSGVSLEDAGAEQLEGRQASPDGQLLAGELSGAIRDALLELPEDGRTVFLLKVIHQLRYDEISRITGSSVGKLKTDLHRARLQMRQKLLPYVGEQFSGMRGVS